MYGCNMFITAFCVIFLSYNVITDKIEGWRDQESQPKNNVTCR